jgi:hypothetical protein
MRKIRIYDVPREKDEQMLRALEMRDAGMTSTQIARRLGSTASRWRKSIWDVWNELAECTE